MKTAAVMMTRTGTVLALLLLSATARAESRAARGYVADAIDEVDDSSRACRRAVLDELLEIKALLGEEREARAALKLQRVRERAGDCPRSVDRALRRASEALAEGRAQLRERTAEARDRLAPARPTDLPWKDLRSECIDQYVMVEVARGRMPDAQVDLFADTFRAGCTSEHGLGTGAIYYPSGRTARSGGTWYYPNGRTALSGTTIYYPSGTTARSGDVYYYPSGKTAWSASTGWYYPNGKLAGPPDVVVSWGRRQANKATLGIFDYHMQSDVEVYRMFHIVRLLTGG